MTQSVVTIDIEAVRDHFQNTYELTRAQSEKMVLSACRSVTETMSLCQESADEKEMKKLSEAAHNLKGVLRNMGQAGLAECAAQLESATFDKNADNRDLLLQKLWSGVKHCLEYHNQEGVNLE